MIDKQVAVVMSLLLSPLLFACSESHHATNHGPETEESTMNVDKNAAVAIATDVLEADGKEVGNYDVSVTDDGEEWEVAFVGKHPRPPGDEIYVYVHKASGTMRTMYGE